MTEQIKCPAREPMHHAGVNPAGIRKHIYSCKALKKKDEPTKVYQCQYCLTHFYLTTQELDSHVANCSYSHTTKIPWCEKIHSIIIAADPHLKPIEPQEANKHWEYFRDKKEKLKEKKRLSVQQPSNNSPNSYNDEDRSQSPSHIDSPKKQKKVKTQSSSPPLPPPSFEISQEEKERQEKLMKENDEKIRVNYLEELNAKMKVDAYQDILFD